jgi:hypothetical protein
MQSPVWEARIQESESLLQLLWTPVPGSTMVPSIFREDTYYPKTRLPFAYSDSRSSADYNLIDPNLFTQDETSFLLTFGSFWDGTRSSVLF